MPFIEDSREKVTGEMQAMVISGLTTLVRTPPSLLNLIHPIDLYLHLNPLNKNRPLLSTSLQTASNLRVLPSLVQNLVQDLSEAVEERIKSAFDLSRIGKDVLAKGAFRFILILLCALGCAFGFWVG